MQGTEVPSKKTSGYLCCGKKELNYQLGKCLPVRRQPPRLHVLQTQINYKKICCTTQLPPTAPAESLSSICQIWKKSHKMCKLLIPKDRVFNSMFKWEVLERKKIPKIRKWMLWIILVFQYLWNLSSILKEPAIH